MVIRINWNGLVATLVLVTMLGSCKNKVSVNQEMIDLLADIEKRNSDAQNAFNGKARVIFFDSASKEAKTANELQMMQNMLLISQLEAGDENAAINTGELLLKTIPVYQVDRRNLAMKNLALGYMRLAERINCITDHTIESCVFPIAGRGVHADKSNAEKAITLYEEVLKRDPLDFDARWLLNIAYMTTGGYPGRVPPPFLINGLDMDTVKTLKAFTDAAVNVGLNTKNLAGGSIVDDFNNDGYLDLVTSSWSLKEGMHYCRNNADGTFTDISDSSGLGFITGGLNMMQTDYNNDGFKDIFVTRGGWMKNYGRQPNSLLQNNGDGTFTDVTKQSGLLSFIPTQTATWADFNNDGWLDVFIGNETSSPEDVYPCELYINNKNGTFTEAASAAGCNVAAFVKGVTSGDYDNDGLTDLFVSTLGGPKYLLKNTTVKGGPVTFKNVTAAAGLSTFTTRTFPTWFWDYDNDGWLDIVVCGYEFNGSLAPYLAKEALGIPSDKSGKVFLFHNNQNGTFEEVSDKLGLTQFAFAMGSNFGDIDNDGYPDMYLGSGNPLYQSLVPNKLFRNVQGVRFEDVTTASRMGNLQKGHGVSFADMDDDGDEDVYIEMGGAYDGDAYQNSLYVNPRQNDNRWINILLEGTTSNRAAIGAKIKVTFSENGKTRSVYRHVNSGGSFGANPLLQHIGIGQATAIDTIEITWPASNTVQVFRNLAPGQTLRVKEGSNELKKSKNHTVDFTSHSKGIISCKPR